MSLGIFWLAALGFLTEKKSCSLCIACAWACLMCVFSRLADYVVCERAWWPAKSCLSLRGHSWVCSAPAHCCLPALLLSPPCPVLPAGMDVEACLRGSFFCSLVPLACMWLFILVENGLFDDFIFRQVVDYCLVCSGPDPLPRPGDVGPILLAPALLEPLFHLWNTGVPLGGVQTRSGNCDLSTSIEENWPVCLLWATISKLHSRIK